MITVKNISSALVVLTVPELRFRRELRPGREVPLSQEEYDTMMFDPGINNMVQDHFIIFNGVESDKSMNLETEPVLDVAAIKKMLEKQDITSFAKFIPTAAPAEKDTVIRLAVDMGITNSGFVALIKKYCDVDIISAINTKHQVEE